MPLRCDVMISQQGGGIMDSILSQETMFSSLSDIEKPLTLHASYVKPIESTEITYKMLFPLSVHLVF